MSKPRYETLSQWDHVARALGIPWDWKLRPLAKKGGGWTLTATGRGHPLSCGHQSMQVTAPTLPLAVARMAQRLRFHLEED